MGKIFSTVAINFSMQQRRLIVTLLSIISVIMGSSFAKEVHASGYSKSGSSTDRTLALSAALEAAVTQEGGVKKCVKTFQIISSGLTQDGGYAIQIKAEVDDQAPNEVELHTIRSMTREFSRPRIAVKIEENIEGDKDGTIVEDWLKDKLCSCGLIVVDIPGQQGKSGMLEKRAELLARHTEAAIRREGLISSCDYFIEGKLEGHSGNTQTYYGSSPMQKFSLGLSLKLIDSATGTIILTENFPTKEMAVKRSTSIQMDVREAVRHFMEGKAGVSDYGWQLIRRMIAHWIMEKREGAIYKIEFIRMELEQLQRIKKKLEQDANIGAIWVRSIDAAAVTIIECESKLSASDLAEKIARLLPDFTLDRSENKFLSFRQGNIITPLPENSDAEKTIISWNGVATTVSASIIFAILAAIFRWCCRNTKTLKLPKLHKILKTKKSVNPSEPSTTVIEENDEK